MARLLVSLALTSLAAAQTSDVSFPVVDTSEVSCYDNSTVVACPGPYLDQDANVIGWYQPHYVLSADNLTVTDTTTGLMWRKTVDINGDGVLNETDRLTATDGAAYINTLNAQAYAGYTDWRLPSIKELYQLIMYNGTDLEETNGATNIVYKPFIDTNYFDFAYGDTNYERIIDVQEMSDTYYVYNLTGQLFGVNFADGRIKGYPTDANSGTLFNVRAVRGNNTAINNLVKNNDGTISDLATGLMWTENDSGVGLDWPSAFAWADEMNSAVYANYSDWRVPNSKELQSIVDYTRAPDVTNSPAISELFNTTSIINELGQVDYPYFWSSTTHENFDGDASRATFVSFGRAIGYVALRGASCYTALDVHGAGSQKSDYKTGQVTDHYFGADCNGGSAYGHGPQGDAVRIYNFVRLVRDIDPVALADALANSTTTDNIGF